MRRFILLATLVLPCCRAAGHGATVLYASGADLQSVDPLFTRHPLALQVQRYVLLTTLVRYDSALRLQPYLARHWTWSPDGRRLTLRLFPGLRWHDGVLTTARDVAWTLERARDLATGYPRYHDLAPLAAVTSVDDTTLVLQFRDPPGAIPDVLAELAILPRHLLDTVPLARLRQAGWHEHPVGNGPFRFVAHEAHRRWVFERNPDFPAELGGPPRLERFIVAVVAEPMTKLAALTAGEIDFAGIQPAHASFVARDSDLVVREYPVLFPTGIVFNARRPPFDRLEARQAVDRAVDRRQLVDGFAWGFATPAEGPVPPELSSALTVMRGAWYVVRGACCVPCVEHCGQGTEFRDLSSEFRVPTAGQNTQHASLSTHHASRTTHHPEVALHFELLTVGSGEAALEQMVQAQLSRTGIRVTIRQLELSAFLARVYGPTHDFDAALLGTPGDLGLGYLGPLAALSGLEPPSGRAALLRFYRDQLPVSVLYHPHGVQGANRRVRGVVLSLAGELESVTRWETR